MQVYPLKIKNKNLSSLKNILHWNFKYPKQTNKTAKRLCNQNCIWKKKKSSFSLFRENRQTWKVTFYWVLNFSCRDIVQLYAIH